MQTYLPLLQQRLRYQAGSTYIKITKNFFDLEVLIRIKNHKINKHHRSDFSISHVYHIRISGI
jgi:hypothetical protein